MQFSNRSLSSLLFADSTVAVILKEKVKTAVYVVWGDVGLVLVCVSHRAWRCGSDVEHRSHLHHGRCSLIRRAGAWDRNGTLGLSLPLHVALNTTSYITGSSFTQIFHVLCDWLAASKTQLFMFCVDSVLTGSVVETCAECERMYFLKGISGNTMIVMTVVMVVTGREVGRWEKGILLRQTWITRRNGRYIN